jgi:hypothetical protein
LVGTKGIAQKKLAGLSVQPTRADQQEQADKSAAKGCEHDYNSVWEVKIEATPQQMSPQKSCKLWKRAETILK